ncbi:polysaccharide deacetylase family protein [uncultured Fibrobacter sp.]|uniref:polysaccharide deacetylase family protein n=1 Tax=uncultured Fibrobacter sp. TaxID=261512 RepID=UPI0025EB2E77|nr:polysaccharide deacetylase family protein [uncultured Fibrobacter sp.]
MDYKKIAISPAVVIGAAGLFAATATFAQTAEIGTWAGFRKGAVSFTFDDGAPSHVSDAGPLFDKYGYKATFNLVVNWNPDWSGFGNMAKNGHEIASHSNTHGNNMSGEEASSKKAIEGKIQQKYGIITLAYPNCNVPNESAVLQNYIVGRICNSGNSIVGKDGPSNWAQVPAIMTGPNGSNDFKGPMGSVVNSNSWVSFLTHGFSGKNNGNANYSPTDIGLIEDALKYAQQNDKDIWVAPMGHVAMYIKERKAAKIEASGSGTITVKLTHSIKDNVSDYDYPLSIRVKYDGSKAEVTQAGAKLESKIDGGYVYFDAVPNAGDIVISGEGGGTSQPTESSSSSAPSSAASSSSNPGTKVSSSSHNHGSHHGSSSSIAQSSSSAPIAVSSSSGPAALPSQTLDVSRASAYVDASGYITVINAQGENITVFNNLGKVVRTTRGLGCLQKVYSGAKGMYIVRIGNTAKTVVIK